MPRDFINGKGVDKAPDLIEIENMSVGCDYCYSQADKVYYNTDSKKIMVICENGHVSNIEGNWEHIFRPGK